MSALIKPMSRGRAATRGLVAAAVGVALIVWPGITIGTVAVLFAIWAVGDAIAVGSAAFRSGASGGDRVLLLLRAAIETAAGVLAIAYPGVTVAVMTVIAGLSLITLGGTELWGARTLSRLGADGTGRIVAGGVFSLLAGITLVVWPGLGAVTLAVLFGAYLVVSGATLLVAAIAAPHRERVAAPLARA